MDFLALVNALRREAGVSGSDLTSVSGQTGEANRCVNWVNQAWLDIQNAHQSWLWMRSSDSFNTTSPTDSYSVATIGPTSFSEWLTDTFRCYLASTGRSDEQFLTYLPYDEFRDYYDFGTQATLTGRPLHFTVKPDSSIWLGPDPDATYTVTCDYMKAASSLAVNTDAPGLPVQYHNIIVYRALMSYALFESAPEVLARAKSEFNRWMSRLEANQLPQLVFGAPLVA